MENKRALICGDVEVTRNEFMQKCHACSDFLKNYVSKRDRIALIHKKSIELFVILYTAFQDGIGLILIDPINSDDRIQEMLEEANPSLIITDNATYPDKYKNVILSNVIFEYVDNFDYSFSTRKFSDFIIEEGMESVIFFTSGSSGKPKGVISTKEGYVNYIKAFAKVIDMTGVERIPCFCSLSFDVIINQTILALFHGLTVIIPTEYEQNDPRGMTDCLRKNNADILNLTPSAMNMILSYDNELQSLQSIKILVLGGEKVSINLLRHLQSKIKARIYNQYGPTEASVFVTVSDLTDKTELDEGQPYSNCQIYILDQNNHVLPAGITGQIAIAGVCLAKGYLNEVLTKEKFILLPPEYKHRVYLTGDMGRLKPNGDLICLGRMDNQIKWHGFRIELEEIENTIMEFPGVIQCLAGISNIHEDVLALWYTGDPINIEVLIPYLSQKLPQYMVPSRFYRVEEFKYSTSGKKARNISELRIIDDNGSVEKNNCLSDTEKAVLKILEKNVDESMLPLDLSVYLRSVGINSINFVKIILDIETEFNVEFDENILLFQNLDTIASLADCVHEKSLRG